MQNIIIAIIQNINNEHILEAIYEFIIGIIEDE